MPRPSRDQQSIRNQYLVDGFYMVDDIVLNKCLVNAAVEGMEEICAGRYDRGREPDESVWNPGDDSNKLCKIENPQRANHAVYDLVRHPALGQLAAQMTGAKMVQVWWVQLLIKPAHLSGSKNKTNIGWHQDRHYWSCWEESSELFTAWCALSDVQPDCGPMIFLRESHQWGYLKGRSDFAAQEQNMDSWRQELESQGRMWHEVPNLLPAGGISFHNHLTFHGSKANYSGRPRRSLAIHMRTENSAPLSEPNHLTSYLNDPDVCPIVYGRE